MARSPEWKALFAAATTHVVFGTGVKPAPGLVPEADVGHLRHASFGSWLSKLADNKLEGPLNAELKAQALDLLYALPWDKVVRQAGRGTTRSR